MSKKIYARPTVTDLGNVVKETRGVGGICWEIFGSQWGPPIRPDLETEDAHD